MARRFVAQLLSGGEQASSAVDVARRLLAIQGQDPRGARLAIRARSTGLTSADVEQALTGDRSVLITWLNRGTLHLVCTEDYWWLHPLTVRPPLMVGVRRRLGQLGVSEAQADKGVAVIVAALANDGPRTRAQLREAVASAGLPVQGYILVHLIALASMQGMVVRGPMVSAQHAYVLVRDWLGKPPPALDPDVALAELATRYLAGHGPASEHDLAKWAGVPLGQARRGLSAVAAQLRDRSDGLAELAEPSADSVGAPSTAMPPPRLLGAYDPVLLGWASRKPIVGGYYQLVTVNGLFRPFALVDGKAAGVWKWSDGQVELNRFTRLPEHIESVLGVEAQDVRRFLAAEPSAE